MENKEDNRQDMKVKRGRPSKKQDASPEKITDTYVNYVVEYYLEACKTVDETDGFGTVDDENKQATASIPKHSLRSVAKELHISNTKLKKLLITGGVYDFGKLGSEATILRILNYHKQGKSVSEICTLVGLKRSAVEGCLPYEKIVYKAGSEKWVQDIGKGGFHPQRSLNAERCGRYRKKKNERKADEQKIQEDVAITTFAELWTALIDVQGYPFRTAKNLSFTYKIKGNEMFVDRKEKSITRATVELAYRRAVDMGGIVAGPKKLGCFGASYLYPVFIRLGVIRDAKTEKNVGRTTGKDTE